MRVSCCFSNFIDHSVGSKRAKDNQHDGLLSESNIKCFSLHICNVVYANALSNDSLHDSSSCQGAEQDVRTHK